MSFYNFSDGLYVLIFPNVYDFLKMVGSYTLLQNLPRYLKNSLQEEKYLINISNKKLKLDVACFLAHAFIF